jgi:hypothetical protein
MLPILLAVALLAPTTRQSPAEAADIAQLHAEADAVIARARAHSQFSNDTRWDFPAVRHRASGLRCLFQKGDRANEIVWIGGVNTSGVGCVSRPAGFRQTLEAVKLRQGETLDAVFNASVLNVTWQRPEAKLYEGDRMVVRVEPQPGGPVPAEARSARYVISKQGEAVFSLVSVALVDGWVIRQSFEAPLARAEEADMLAGVVMSTTLIDLAARGA